MRKRPCNPVWQRAGGRYPVTLNLLGMATLMLAATLLGGCIVEIPTPTLDLSTGRDRLPLDETGPWTYRDPTEKELLLARSDFSVEIVRFTDSRRPRSMEAQSRDQLIYAYDPDVLLGGVSYNVPGILGKYLSYRPRMPKHYKVEIDVRKLTTVIKTGTLLSGSWGRYSVAMELSVIARRPDSTVAMQKTFRYDVEQRREDYNGRGPTKERDRARMVDLTESMLRNAAEDIGWNLRQRDARTWKVDAPQSIPTKLNLPPVDAARGTVENDIAPRVAPAAPAYAPVSSSPDSWVDGPLPEDVGVPAPVLPEPEGDMGPVI